MPKKKKIDPAKAAEKNRADVERMEQMSKATRSIQKKPD
jgi:hypothetical protein